MKQLIAEQIMNGDVLFAEQHWTIKHLAKYLKQHSISGAPVVDQEQKLVGAVSATDVFKFGSLENSDKVAVLRNYYQIAYANDVDLLDLESWTHNAEDSCTVQQIMTDYIIAVNKSTPIKEICSIMLEHKIHRVFVVEDNKVVGVISSSDIMHAVVEAA